MFFERAGEGKSGNEVRIIIMVFETAPVPILVKANCSKRDTSQPGHVRG